MDDESSKETEEEEGIAVGVAERVKSRALVGSAVPASGLQGGSGSWQTVPGSWGPCLAGGDKTPHPSTRWSGDERNVILHANESTS